MTDSATLLIDIAMRLIGAFYVVTAPLILRAGATNLLLTRALSAISMKASRADRVEAQRIRFLSGMALVTGAGGILLAARLDLALPVFVFNAATYALYLLVLAPRFFDPWDEPDEGGRRQTRNAFFVYVAATAIVGAAGWMGALRPARHEHPAVLVVCAAAFAVLCVYAFRTLRQARIGQPGGHAAGTGSGRHDPDPPPRLVLTPSWYGTGLVDADTGQPAWLPPGELPPGLADRIAEWLELFASLADPDDPWRQKLRKPSDQARIAAAGQPIFEALSGHFGVEHVRFEPEARPCGSPTAFTAMKVAAILDSDPLWEMRSAGENAYEGSCSAHHVGISWALATALVDWAQEYDASFENGERDGRRLWTDRQAADHCRRGMALARRLAAEFTATGRAGVAVWFDPENGPAVRIDG
jgi:hypothetical protein